jgi:hypothetical protein
MRKILMLAVGLTVVVLSAAAHAAVVRYMSQHPLPRKLGGGFCYIDVPHVHDFGPSDPRMYRQVDGEYYFVGDPTPFDYQGPRTAYYGPHPIVDADVQLGQPAYCYLQGPHFHAYAPPPQAAFELRGGAYWFTGTYDPTYYDQRPRYVAVNEAYAPMVYDRPVVDVSVVPVGFHGELVGGGPGWRGRAYVGGPAVGVVVAPPPPVQIGVGINLGGPVVVEHEGHDDGRGHGGWGHRGPEGGWRGPPPRGGGWRGEPQRGSGWRGEPQRGSGWRGEPQRGSGWRGEPQRGSGWRGEPAHASGGWRGAPAAPAHGGGGSHGGGGGKPSGGHGSGGWQR